MLVIKNYNAGLSGMLNDPENDLAEYEVKGPLGQSLQVQKSGLHIAFTAGTGVLPIMDLVLHLLLTTLGLNKSLGVGTGDEVGPDFRLRLYVSHRTRKEAIALDLLEAIHELYKQKGDPSFELITRISSE
jgi:hypothetical protein